MMTFIDSSISKYDQLVLTVFHMHIITCHVELIDDINVVRNNTYKIHKSVNVVSEFEYFLLDDW